MFDSLKKIFRSSPVADLCAAVAAVNALEPAVKQLDLAALRAASDDLRAKAKAGTPLDELLPHAFALAREASVRTLEKRPFDVQLMGGIVLHRGAVAEMVTGEGKTLAAVAPAYLNALAGEGVHVVTVNEYLARRDTVWMGQIYHALGLRVACLVPNAAFLYDPAYTQKNADDNADQRGSISANPRSNQRESALLDRERDTTGGFLVQQEFLRPIPRREAYLADVTYGTNHEFGFDYLRDNLAYRVEDQVQCRGAAADCADSTQTYADDSRRQSASSQRESARSYAIIDEADSILIDEARTPLIISVPDAESSDFYKTFARVVTGLERDADFAVDEKLRSVAITEAGIEKVEKMVGVPNLYAPDHLRLVHYLEESLRAKALFTRDKDYVVKNGEIIIVDEFTGRLLHGRRYNGGLHQAIEAKEGVAVQQESRTYAKISIQNYFRMYKKISGMTGTAQTSAEEFYKVYGLEVVSIPTHRPLIRQNAPDRIYRNAAARWRAVVGDIGERHAKGQPVLVGTTSIEKNELLSSYLSQTGVPHEVLNAKNNEREGAIIAQAGRRGAVTVATNMAGRGVDIILGGNPPDAVEAQKIIEVGGLHVVGTERHEARRIDNQLRGRAGRQGDPGSSQFFLSLEDDLLRIFGGDRIKSMMERFDLPEDEPIQMGFVSKAVAQAQAKVEGANFDMRKHLLEYDDVLNKQRAAVYRRRQEILELMGKEELARRSPAERDGGGFADVVAEAAKDHAAALANFFGTTAASAALNEGEPADADASAGKEAGESSAPKNLKQAFEEAGIADAAHPFPAEPTPEALGALIGERSTEAVRDPQTAGRVLSILDLLWMTHLENLEALSESVGLRAYGQKDPLVEYRHEAHRLFRDFWANFNGWIFANVFKLARTGADKRGSAISVNPRSYPRESAATDKVGRNDPCPCGAKHPDGRPMKYKHCHGKNV
jgi:preprotein translocase subunit SecA